LSEGGITPSAGLVSMVREAVDIQLYVIVRPRGGNFVYSEPELAVMRRDIVAARTQGVDGVVLGALNGDDTVDRAHTRGLIGLARPMRVTFHRAFDVCRDLNAALEDVIACGADRLLTAGGRSDAIKGLDAIAGLQQRAAGRIRIMAGGGIRIGNVRKIALRTGICDVHTSLSTKARSTSYDGGADGSDLQGGLACYVVKESDVRAFKSVLHAIATGAAAHVQ